MNDDDSLYTPKEGAAIATFMDQRADICAEMLSRGVRRGDEWIVRDFQNNEGTSLHVEGPRCSGKIGNGYGKGEGGNGGSAYDR
jgi:hypothetical protein